MRLPYAGKQVNRAAVGGIIELSRRGTASSTMTPTRTQQACQRKARGADAGARPSEPCPAVPTLKDATDIWHWIL